MHVLKYIIRIKHNLKPKYHFCRNKEKIHKPKLFNFKNKDIIKKENQISKFNFNISFIIKIIYFIGFIFVV